MSLEVIEIMIRESLADGEISVSEKDAIIKHGESYGISKEIVISMIDAEVDRLNNKASQESKQKQEEEAKKEIERAKLKIKDEKIALEQEKKKKNNKYHGNFSEWESNFDEINFFTWGLLYGGIGLFVGILNAYTHDKSWGAYIGMLLLGLIYGYMAYGIVVGLTFLTKRKPLLDWHKPVLIAYGVLVLALICYLVIPF